MAAASSFTHLVSSFCERRFPAAFGNTGDISGLVMSTLRDAERGGTAVIILCVDLTEQVLAEAVGMHANSIIALSPLSSEPLRTLILTDPVGRIVLRCAAQGIAVHSLHTAAANSPRGIADWFASSISTGLTRPIVPHAECAEAGEGRLLECDEAASLSAIISQIKAILGVRHLRIAFGAIVDEHHLARASDSCFVKSIAVQIGESSHLLQHILQMTDPAFAGVFVAPEMPHADVLAANAKGIIVLLTGQSTVERAFLRHMRQEMQEDFTNCDWNVKVKCSEVESHTLAIV